MVRLKPPDILIVDDEAKYRRLLHMNLALAGFTVRQASTGIEAVKAVTDRLPSLILLDVLLPDIDGFEVLRRLRKVGTVPVILVTALDAKMDVVRGLDEGADDYLVKPFSLEEVVARVRAVLRRASLAVVETEEEILRCGSVTLDPQTRTLTSPTGTVHLTPTEWQLMRELMSHCGAVVTHEHLLARVWGEEYLEEENYLRVYVRRLRTYLEPDPGRPVFLVTYPGVGYGLKG